MYSNGALIEQITSIMFTQFEKVSLKHKIDMLAEFFLTEKENSGA